MNVAIVNSNYVRIDENTKKGTEIFDYILINGFSKYKKNPNLSITAFASGDSQLATPIEWITPFASLEDEQIGVKGHEFFELGLLSKAFSAQDHFDLYHFNIGNGDLALPFLPFLKKPIIVTMHASFLESKYTNRYMSLFNQMQRKNIFFVSISDTQRFPFPNLNYAKTIYHGIESDMLYRFNASGGENILWAGRAIPEKGLDTLLEVINRTGKRSKIFIVRHVDYLGWLKNTIEQKIVATKQRVPIAVEYDKDRLSLIEQYQTSKVFLFPTHWEEPFGLVLIESMSCGTPVIAFARGSIPEIIKDGQTGFLVNPSDSDIRGNWIVQKTGIEGLCEAIERLYNLTHEEYRRMRKNCREHVEKNFTVKRMISEYESLYEELVKKYKNQSLES